MSKRFYSTQYIQANSMPIDPEHNRNMMIILVCLIKISKWVRSHQDGGQYQTTQVSDDEVVQEYDQEDSLEYLLI